MLEDLRDAPRVLGDDPGTRHTVLIGAACGPACALDRNRSMLLCCRYIDPADGKMRFTYWSTKVAGDSAGKVYTSASGAGPFVEIPFSNNTGCYVNPSPFMVDGKFFCTGQKGTEIMTGELGSPVPWTVYGSHRSCFASPRRRHFGTLWDRVGVVFARLFRCWCWGGGHAGGWATASQGEMQFLVVFPLGRLLTLCCGCPSRAGRCASPHVVSCPCVWDADWCL